jgi:hypothetical protein
VPLAVGVAGGGGVGVAWLIEVLAVEQPLISSTAAMQSHSANEKHGM